MIDFKFDLQLLIEGTDLSEDDVYEYISAKLEGDSLLVIGDETLLKIHYHTNSPWRAIEYCASLGDIHDIIVENMERQAKGLQG